jgi:DNA invertase Pin-like site-specific DNA recombinase
MTTDDLPMIGYLRVSTGEQVESGLGLRAQRDRIEDVAHRRGWQIVGWATDEGLSGATMTKRVGLENAIADVEAGVARGIVAAKLDRLSRSVLDFADLLQRADRRGWSLVVLDVDVDMTTPVGRLVVHILSAVAEFERRIIAQRTRDALAVKKTQGEALGRPDRAAGEVLREIAELREQGLTYQRIADALNAEQVPTVQGGRQWYAATVCGIVRRMRGQAA